MTLREASWQALRAEWSSHWNEDDVKSRVATALETFEDLDDMKDEVLMSINALRALSWSRMQFLMKQYEKKEDREIVELMDQLEQEEARCQALTEKVEKLNMEKETLKCRIEEINRTWQRRFIELESTMDDGIRVNAPIRASSSLRVHETPRSDTSAWCSPMPDCPSPKARQSLTSPAHISSPEIHLPMDEIRETIKQCFNATFSELTESLRHQISPPTSNNGNAEKSIIPADSSSSRLVVDDNGATPAARLVLHSHQHMHHHHHSHHYSNKTRRRQRDAIIRPQACPEEYHEGKFKLDHRSPPPDPSKAGTISSPSEPLLSTEDRALRSEDSWTKDQSTRPDSLASTDFETSSDPIRGPTGVATVMDKTGQETATQVPGAKTFTISSDKTKLRVRERIFAQSPSEESERGSKTIVW